MKKVTFNLYMDKEEGKFNLVLTAEDSKEQSCVTLRNYEHIDFETVCKVLSIRNKGEESLPADGFSSQVKRFNAHLHSYFDLARSTVAKTAQPNVLTSISSQRNGRDCTVHISKVSDGQYEVASFNGQRCKAKLFSNPEEATKYATEYANL